MKRNYDTIAYIYDRFAALVFGAAQVDAQAYLLTAIPRGARLLIIGGGTGRILEDLARQYNSLSITYIDASAKMIAQSRLRNMGGNTVELICGDVAEVLPQKNFDVIFTPFLFDNFTQQQAEQVGSMVYDRVCEGGLWLYCDFRKTEVWWQSILLRTMYLFFRAVCGIRATRLPDVSAVFTAERYSEAGRAYFCKGFIESVIYKKRAADT